MKTVLFTSVVWMTMLLFGSPQVFGQFAIPVDNPGPAPAVGTTALEQQSLATISG